MLKHLMSVFVLFSLFLSLPTYAAQAGDSLGSSASVNYFYNGQSFTQSDDAYFIVEEEVDSSPSTPAEMDVWGPVDSADSDADISVSGSQCSGSSVNSSLTYADGSTLSLPSTIPSQENDVFKAGNPLIIRIVDFDENTDDSLIETVTVTLTSSNPSDSEELVLYETSSNSGEFVGIIQTTATDTASTNDCDLALTSDSILSIDYQDDEDPSDSLNKTLTFDPYSRVFNAYTGALIDGITLRLIDNSTGSLATLFGDDGISTFPAEITSGGTVQDSSGKTYSFPTGSYRFPYVPNGDYRLEMDESYAFSFPSETSDQVIQTLPEAPYELNDLSKGEVLSSSNLLLTADIPLDPITDRILLDKSSTKSEAGIGDFVPFDISLTNVDEDIEDLQLIDTLPIGLTYVEGSLKVNDETYTDVEISSTGQLITVNFPDLEASEVVSISYVSQVSATASGEVVNQAVIAHSILESNIATATIVISDDLMRDSAQIFGRIILDDCDGNLDAEGVSGIRLIMEDGRYVVSDEEGQWHLENIEPGTHVVQLDVATLPAYLELATCDNKFFHAGQSYSQFVDVQAGSLWRADFHVQPKKPENGDVMQTLLNELIPFTDEDSLANYGSPVDKKVIYTANVGGAGVALNEVVEKIILPEGVTLKEGSLTLDGQPHVYNYANNTISIELGDKPKTWSHEIKFSAIISATAKKGILAAQATLYYKIGPLLKDNTPAAETRIKLFVPPANGNADPLKNPKFESLSNVLTVQDKNNLSDVIDALEGLKDLEISVVGHTDNVRIAKRNHHIYPDNQALSEARAASVAKYISEQIGLPIESIKIAGLGKVAPINSNKTADGRAKNRRVEVRVLKATSDVALASIDIDVQIAKTQTLIPGLDLNQATAAGEPEDQIIVAQQPTIDDVWFADKNIETNWVWPPKGYSSDISATNILVQHPKNNRVRLTLNGVPVHSIYFEGIKRANGKAVSVSEWRGINIEEGENKFVAEILDRDENVIDYVAHSVYFSGAPTHAEIVPEMSNLIADGIQVPVIAVRFKDKNGYSVRKNTQGEIQISDPFQLLQRSEYDISPLNDTTKLSYRVEGDGIAFIRLQPTTQTGEMTLTFNHANGLTDEIRSWFKPASRDWILVALGDLTIGANAASSDASSLSNGSVDENIYHEGRLAFYTKGQIPGDFLLTASYDSEKEETTPFATLVQSGEYYTLYADASQQGQDASSGDKLYIKIEKDRFYALYGDISTGLDNTELASYVRSLTGAQVVYQNDLIELSGFASETDSSFVRDEIQANGTSGLYELSNDLIVSSSETIRIESRNRLNNQEILSTTTLQRNLDYSLDYTDGSLYFKSPIATTDSSFNPNYIVVDYETEDDDGGYVIGGRAGLKLLDDTLKTGITIIDEDQGEQGNQLNAVDATLDLGPLTLSAEIAQTRPRGDDDFTAETSSDTEKTASAKKIEAKLRTSTAEITAYTQRIDEDFGLDQQNQSDLDQQSTGINAKIYLTDQDQLEIDGLYQTEISSGYDTQQGALQWTHNLSNSSSFNIGLLSNMQESDDGLYFVDELSVGASAPVLSQDLRVSVTATTDITERSEENDSIILGTEYRWTDTLTTFANYERSFNDTNIERTAIGLRTQPWQGGQAEQSLVQETQNDGYSLYSESGLSHDWKVDEHWLVSFGFNQSTSIEEVLPEEETTTDDYNAISTGWGYRSDQWQWTNRLERRMASTSNTHSASSSLYRPLSSSMAIGGSLEFYKQVTDPAYDQTFDATLDFALRPRKQPFALLFQTRWVQDRASTGEEGGRSESRRIINNAHINWMFDSGNQLAAQYGFKNVLDQYDGEDYKATVHYLASEFRHNFNETWDIGLHGRELISSAEQQQNSYGLSIGVRPVKNVWASIGYNFEGFVDSDFSASNYTSKGLYLKMRFKADQNTLSSLRQAFNW